MFTDEKRFFILLEDDFLSEMLAGEIDEELIDCEDNPAQQKIADYHLDRLANDKNVIRYSDDLIFITGITYKQATFRFGQAVLNYAQTKGILAEIIYQKCNADYYDVFDLVRLDRELEAKEDIQKWLDDLLEKAKKIQPLGAIE